MRSALMLCVVLAVATMTYAKEPKHYQPGKLLQMDSVPCGAAEKDAKSRNPEAPATDSASQKAQAVSCQEYLLQAERVIYRIRPRHEKHPALVPVGETAQFRIAKDRLWLRVGDFDGKERQYTVRSMSPRSDANSADATPTRINHLQ